MDLEKKDKNSLKQQKEKKTRVSKKDKEPITKVSKVKTMKRRDFSKMTKKESEILKTRRNCIQRFRGKMDVPLVEEMEPVKEVKEKKVKEVKEKKVKEVKDKKVKEVKDKK